MIKSYIVNSTYNNMRLDRWLRNKIGNLPQSLIEKSLRSGKIKINRKKAKSSLKVKTKSKTKWIIEKIYPYLLKPEKKEYAVKVLGYTPESKNLSDWTRAELINYISTAFEGDGSFWTPKTKKTITLEFYSSDSEYISLMKYILEEKLNLPLFIFFEKSSYNTINGEKTMYMISKSFSQKNTAEHNDFFKEMIEAMTMDRKRQIVIDYLKTNEVE